MLWCAIIASGWYRSAHHCMSIVAAMLPVVERVPVLEGDHEARRGPAVEHRITGARQPRAVLPAQHPDGDALPAVRVAGVPPDHLRRRHAHLHEPGAQLEPPGEDARAGRLGDFERLPLLVTVAVRHEDQIGTAGDGL